MDPSSDDFQTISDLGVSTLNLNVWICWLVGTVGGEYLARAVCTCANQDTAMGDARPELLIGKPASQIRKACTHEQGGGGN